jgi:hypothetical protein
MSVGPPDVSQMLFKGIGGLGNMFQQGFDGAQKRAREQERRGLLSELGPLLSRDDADFKGAAARALALGDADLGLGLLKLGETAADKSRGRAAQEQFNRLLGDGGVSQSSSQGDTYTGAPRGLFSSESGGRFDAQNDAVGAGGARGHFGRVQFGQARLQEAAAAGAIPAGTTPQQFMASPELQRAAERWHFADIDNSIRQMGIDTSGRQTINGVPITRDGLVAVAHLGGTRGMQRFVETGGRYNPRDVNGTSLMDYFSRMGGRGQPTQVAQPGGVQVAETEADVQRMEAQMARGQAPQGAPVQMAQAGGVMADAPAQDAQAAQGFAPPQRPQVSDLPPGDPAPTVATQALIAEMNNPDLPAGQRQFAQNIVTNRQAWARDGESRMLQRENLRMQQERNQIELERARASQDPNALARQEAAKLDAQMRARETQADRLGLQGDDRKFFIANGRVATASDKLTNDQANAGLYADRMRASNSILERPEISGAGMGIAGTAQRLATDFIPGGLGNNLVTKEFQQLDQAQRDFINAVLRRESGAVISEPEFTNARRQYFPQPGDSPEVLAQKARNRQTAIEGISRAGGAAYARDNPPASRGGSPATNQPAPTVRDGATATNQQTGERIVFRNGQWVPLQ